MLCQACSVSHCSWFNIWCLGFRVRGTPAQGYLAHSELTLRHTAGLVPALLRTKACTIAHASLGCHASPKVNTHRPKSTGTREREFFVENLQVRIHFNIEKLWWTGLAQREFEFPLPGSLISTSCVNMNHQKSTETTQSQDAPTKVNRNHSKRITHSRVAKPTPAPAARVKRRSRPSRQYGSANHTRVVETEVSVTPARSPIPDHRHPSRKYRCPRQLATGERTT